MHKRIICLLFAVGILVMTALPANAAGEGKIQVSPQRGGMFVPGGEVTLYRVGEAVEGGYRLSAGVADWIVEDEDIFDPELAGWIIQSTTAEGTEKAIGDSGSVTFTDLEAGVYLIEQTEAAPGYEAFTPFLVVLPLSGPQWEVATYPKVDKAPEENPKTAEPMTLLSGMAGMILSGTGLAVCIRLRRKKAE